MIQTIDLCYRYSKGEELRFPDLQMVEGEHWLVRGESGSGKTTLLHLLAGLRKPTQGNIRIAGTELQQVSSRKLDQFRGKHIGLVFQKPHFVRSINVLQNLVLAQTLAGQKENRERIVELLSRTHMQDYIHSNPQKLSAGQQQRIAIIRAIINKPDLILADEPTSALDEPNAFKVIELIQEQARSVGSTLLVVTHDNRIEHLFDKSVHLSSQKGKDI